MPHSSRKRTPLPSHKLTTTTSQSTSIDDAGWTHVVSRNSTSRHTRLRNPSVISSLLERLTIPQTEAYLSLLSPSIATQHQGPKPAPPRHTQKELQAQWTRIYALWLASGCRARLKQVIENEIFDIADADVDAEAYSSIKARRCGDEDVKSSSPTLINKPDNQPPCPSIKAICLGLGSLSADATRWRTHAMWQLACFIDLANICIYAFFIALSLSNH